MASTLWFLVATATVAPEAIEQIVVTGSRIAETEDDAPVRVEVVTRERIEQSGSESVAELLEEHGGVQIDRSFRGATVEMQGLSSEYVLVLVDGQRAIGRTDDAIDLSRFPVDRVERIELVKGASSALYGADALGGVINIITRGADRPLEAAARLAYGRFDTLDLAGHVAGHAGPFELRLSAGWHRADAYDLSPEDPGTTGSAFDTVEVDGRADYVIDEDRRVIARASYWQRGLDGVDSTSVATFDRKNRQRQLTATIGPELRFDDASRLRITAHGALFTDQYLLDQRGAATLDDLTQTSEQLGQIDAQYDRLFGIQHLVTFGLEGLYQRLESTRLDGGAGTRGRAAAFVQDEWSPFDDGSLTIVPGARVDADSQFGVYATPRLAVRYAPVESVVLRGNAGRGFKAPSFRDQLLVFENPTAGYVVRGNPDLEPEKSWSFGLGAQVRPADGLRGGVDLFHNEVDDLITPLSNGRTGAGAPELYSYVNIDRARTQGVELNASFAVVRGVTVEGGYRLLNAIDVSTGAPLEARARHRATFAVRAAEPTWGLAATARAAVVGERPFYLDDSATPTFARPYATLDARVEKSFLDRGVTAFAGIDNLLDAGDARFLPIPPRALYAGLEGRYAP